MATMRLRLSGIILAGVIACVEARGEEQGSSFTRFVDEGGLEGRLESAVITYSDSNGVEVSLVAAIHWGDRSYYQSLQTILESYDRLLYEGWTEAPDDKRAERENDGPGPLVVEVLLRLESLVMNALRVALGLERQWDRVNYSKERFINVDMDLETFKRRAWDKGEIGKVLRAEIRFLTTYARNVAVRYLLREPSLRRLCSLIFAFVRGDWQQPVKFLLAQESARSGTLESGDLASVLSVTLGERNEIVVRALRDELRVGTKKKIGIFYGAAHMPDFERRFIGELGFKKIRESWLTAWDIRRDAR